MYELSVCTKGGVAGHAKYAFCTGLVHCGGSVSRLRRLISFYVIKGSFLEVESATGPWSTIVIPPSLELFLVALVVFWQSWHITE